MDNKRVNPYKTIIKKQQQTMKRLPYGNSNFGSVITDNYYYVDKTRFIELLENESNKYHFFIRPRKFGKSLFFSTLCHYYDLNKAADFERYFGNLYIGKQPTPRHNSYAVMPFDFSGLSTATMESFAADFSRNIEYTVRFFLSEYADVFPNARKMIEEISQTHPGTGALNLAFQAAAESGKRIFILIDEYDHFANDLIALGNQMGDDVYRRMIRANGLVRDFYETLKTGTKRVLDRIFITGISPVMLDDLTSGFNMASSLTLDLAYNEMMGFTGDEVNEMMRETGVDPDLIHVDMELYYDGYLFHPDGAHRMYNPSMILYFFDRILKEKKAPENIVDDNLKTDYGRLKRLLLNDGNRERLLEITKENGLVANLISKFPIDRVNDDAYFISLLFYMGLLTIDKPEEGSLRLKIPNYSIRTLYWEYLLELTRDLNREVTLDDGGQRAAIRELAYRGHTHPFIDYISRNVFKRLSNRDLIRFDEKYIKIILLNALFQSNLYIPLSEREVEEGYIDLYLQRNSSHPDVTYEWVWELKYLKKSDERELPLRRKEALAALERYRTSRLFAGREDVKYAALLFVGKDRVEIVEI
jgi:hypothetical protein